MVGAVRVHASSHRVVAALAVFCAVAVHAAETSTNRPRVGLVLGGGGALGLSHVGVLKVLEEQRVPVDYIAGTSMGSIIAGLYACGMAPAEIQTFLEGLDWNEILTDATPRRELFFRRKREDQRYLFEMGLDWSGLKMGTGMAAGQKFNNLMQSATLRVADLTEFDRLPIPFRAVATDLQNGIPFVIQRGNLATAMRASMAVPGVFTPVIIDGHVLVDGGIVNNLPVDVVQQMGAEVVIAVDVGADADKVDPASLKSITGIIGRTYAVAQRPEQIEMFRRADVGIQPALHGLTAAQFDRVREFVLLGEQAARGKMAELARLAVSADEYAVFLAKHRRPRATNVVISAIAVTGNQRVKEATIRGRIRSQPGLPFNQADVDRDLMRIYGIGEFEQVLFHLQPAPDGTSTLSYDATEKAWGPVYFKYGLQLRSDFEDDADWAMLLNLTRMSVNSLGAEWRNELEIGSRLDVLSEFYQPVDSHGIVFLAPTVEYRSGYEDIYDDRQHVAEYAVKTAEGRLDLGVQLRTYAELRMGPMWGEGDARVETGSSDLPSLDETYTGWATRLTIDRQDRALFAREGGYLGVQGWFVRDDMGGDVEFNRVLLAGRQQYSWNNHTLVAGLQGGTGLGRELPSYAQFTLGGPFGFAGLAENQFRGSYLGVASLGYRYRLWRLPSQVGRGVYAMVRGDAGNVWDGGIETDDLRYGGAAGLGADTAAGPLYLGYGVADGGYDQWYFSLGTAF